jgi:hypothetical protein
LLQLGVLHLRFLQHREFAIGIFPEAEKIFKRHLRFGPIAGDNIRSAEFKVGQRTQGIAREKSFMIDNLLELDRSLGALMFSEIRLARTQIGFSPPKKVLKSTEGTANS